MQQSQSTLLQELIHLLHEYRDELLPHVFKHANGDNFIVFSGKVSVILANHLDFVLQAQVLYFASGMFNLRL